MSAKESDPSLWVLLFSVALGALLQVYPLSDGLAHWRPDFLFLVLFYWLRRYPFQLGVGFAWVVGLIADIIYGDVLGRMALAYCLTAYILHLLYQRLMHFRTLHETLLILPLVLASQTIAMTVNVILGRGVIWNTILLCAAGSALVWPFFRWVLERLFPARLVRV